MAFILTGCGVEWTAPAEPFDEANAALELTGRVVDAADVLSAEFESELTDKLEQFESDTGAQLVVVTTPNLQDRDVADYTRDLANAWGIGSAQTNDGLVLLVAPDEKRCRIAVGLGLEDTVTNDEAQIVIETAMLPRFQADQFEAGIEAGVDRLILEVRPVELKEAA